MIALLQAAKEHKHMVLDWGAIVANLSKPGEGGRGVGEEPGQLCDAKSFGAVDPKDFVLEVLDCLSDGLADLRAKTGQEVLNWALHCGDSWRALVSCMSTPH